MSALRGTPGRRRRGCGRGAVVLVAAAAAAAALIALELARGGAGYGETRLHDPCLPRTGSTWVLRGLDAVACRRGETREQLLLDAADSPIGTLAVQTAELRQTVERWLEEALQGRQAQGGSGKAGELQEQAFRLLDQLFAR